MRVLLVAAVALIAAAAVLSGADEVEPKLVNMVQVYHFALRYWVSDIYQGDQQCGGNMLCEWSWGESLPRLRIEHEMFKDHGTFTNSPRTTSFKKTSGGGAAAAPATNGTTETAAVAAESEGAGADGMLLVNESVSVGLYNVHSLWEKKRDHYPQSCELRTDLNMIESEESTVRYGHLFKPSFKHFDGFSTTSPLAAVQRVYKEAYVNVTDFIDLKPFSKMIKGASYVASDCHNRDGANANRDNIVREIRMNGIRVDGLGRCLRSPVGPEGVELSKDPASRYNLRLKREVISNFLFNMAFENSIEDGYVTEKPYDALLAGSVPVYLGDSEWLKKILPIPKAVIYLSDFDTRDGESNVTALVYYLESLQTNETAYEEHRAWRKDFSLERLRAEVPILQQTWACRVCSWALANAHKHHKRERHCKDEVDVHGKVIGSTLLADIVKYNGKAVRANGKEVFLYKNDLLQPIPDLNTLFSLNVSLSSILQVTEREFSQMKMGLPLEKAQGDFAEVT